MYESNTFMDKLGNVVTKAGIAIMMNVVFLVCCLPVVTIGQAWCGLMTSVRYQIRGDSWWAGFKFGFKTRFIRGTIIWCIMLLIDGFLMWRTWGVVATFMETGGLPFVGIFGCLAFLLMIMLTTAFLTLNVYIPTDAGTWINNATSMVFKAPLQLLGASILAWLPVILIPIYWQAVAYFITAIVAVYFTIVAFISTVLLKRVLMDYLVEARAEGTLLAEEGRARDENDEDEEDE